MKMGKKSLLVLLIILILIPISINAEETNNTTTTAISTTVITTATSTTTTTKKIDYFTINYVLNGGVNTSKNPKTYKKSSNTITLKNPTRTGYTFKGWYTTNKYKTKVKTIKKGSTGNKTLYAKWTPITYTIKFSGNGSTSGKMSTLTKRSYDKTYILKNNSYKKKGYTFVGWNTKKDGTGVFIKNKATIKNLTTKNKSTIKLYAQWQKNTYTISYNLNGGTIKAINPTKYTYTTKNITLKNPTRTGYTFKGWYTSNKYKTKVKTIKKGSTGNKTLYAKWTPITYTIKFSGNGSTSGKMSTLTKRSYDKTYTLKNNAYKKKGDYTFVGWNTKKDGTGVFIKNKGTVKNLTTKNKGTVTLYAIWKLRTYTIAYNLNGGVNSKSNPISYNINTNAITLKNPTRTGYTFLGWFSDSKLQKKVTTIKKGSTGNKTLYAKWSANKYEIFFDPNNGGISTSIKDVIYDLTYGELPIPTRTGYTFVGWYTSKENGKKVESTTKVNILKNQILYARWQANTYVVSFDANEGIIDETEKTIVYDQVYGELPVPMREDYTFLGWYTSKEFGTKVDKDTKVNILSDQVLYARWQSDYYRVYFDASYGVVDIDYKNVKLGSTYGELPIPTRNNYVFSGWYTSYKGGTKIESTTEYTSTSNTTLYARWISIPTLTSYNFNHFSSLSSSYKNIKNITFENKIEVPANAVYSWDISANCANDVIAYLIKNEENNLYYDLYIQSDTQLYANEDMSYWFANLKDLDSINGLDLVNTSKVKNMKNLFYNTGWNSEKFTLDLGENFDTSQVTNMSGMFRGVGRKSVVFTLDLGDKFDTSKVTDMSGMFTYVGAESSVLKLDLGDKFDTSKVTDMSEMFDSIGEESTNFILDLGDKFDTSNVTNMYKMFRCAGSDSENFTLNLGDKFDTSNVTNMNRMFGSTGESSAIFTLNVSDFKTSNVTDMSCMFCYTGLSNKNFSLDVSNFDTSNVTNMYAMFAYTGVQSTNFALDLSNFDTSNVTNMDSMFKGTGHRSSNFTLNISNFDTSNVIDMTEMFYNTGLYSSNLLISITIRNPNTYLYKDIFKEVATKNSSQIILNYTSETSELVDKMISTKSITSNVIKGSLVE